MKSIRKLEVRARRVPLALEDGEPYGAVIREPRDVREIARALLADEAHEVFIAMLLDVKNRVVGYTEVGRGGIDSCPVDPGAVFRAALIAGASGIIVAHNHPSGDTTPSREDNALTSRLARAGELLGCKILDHVIVTDDERSYSYAQMAPELLK